MRDQIHSPSLAPASRVIASSIQVVDQRTILEVIALREPLGLFISDLPFDGGRYVVIDNQRGEAFTEVFRDREDAIHYLSLPF